MFSNDELFEILSWLPAKPLIRFSSGCKSISNLLKEDRFIKHHCQNWLTDKYNDDGFGFFIQPAAYDSCPRRLELHWLEENRTAAVPDYPMEYMKETSRVLASSNGLVLYRKRSSSELCLCNPATMSTTHIGLPEISRRRLAGVNNNNNPLNTAFFIDSTDGDDNIALWVFESEEEGWPAEYKAYKFDQDNRVWRVKGSIDTRGRNLAMDKPPVYIEGELFFASDCGDYFTKASPYHLPYIVAFDVEKSIHRIIELPSDAYRGFATAEISLFPWEEDEKRSSICLVRLLGLTLTVWVLKRGETWRRVDHIWLKSLGLPADERISGCLVMRGWLIFTTANKVYKYRLIDQKNHDRKLYDIGTHDCGSKVLLDPYVNTMRPCGPPESTIRIPTTIPDVPSYHPSYEFDSTANYEYDDHMQRDDDDDVFYETPACQLAEFGESEE